MIPALIVIAVLVITVWFLVARLAEQQDGTMNQDWLDEQRRRELRG